MVIFWFIVVVNSNTTDFPVFVNVNVGLVRLVKDQYFPSTSGPSVPLSVLTISAVLISIGDCLLPSHFG